MRSVTRQRLAWGIALAAVGCVLPRQGTGLFGADAGGAGGASTTTTTSGPMGGGGEAETTASSTQDGGSGGAPTTTASTTSSSQGGAGGETVGFCDEPSLLACYRFEGDTLDGSPAGHPANAAAVGYAIGKKGQAILLGPSSTVAIPTDPVFGPSQLTLEAWVRPDALPTTGRQGLADNNGRWGLFIYSDGLRCLGGGQQAAAQSPPAGTWSHVACTIDGTIRLYVGGVEVASTPTGPLATGASEPITIGANAPSGDNFLGMLDDLRIFDVARTPSQICQAAGC